MKKTVTEFLHKHHGIKSVKNVDDLNVEKI